jgi:hypothetical protein
MRIKVPAKQQKLEKHQAGGPNGRGTAKPWQKNFPINSWIWKSRKAPKNTTTGKIPYFFMVGNVAEVDYTGKGRPYREPTEWGKLYGEICQPRSEA